MKRYCLCNTNVRVVVTVAFVAALVFCLGCTGARKGADAGGGGSEPYHPVKKGMSLLYSLEADGKILGYERRIVTDVVGAYPDMTVTTVKQMLDPDKNPTADDDEPAYAKTSTRIRNGAVEIDILESVGSEFPADIPDDVFEEMDVRIVGDTADVLPSDLPQGLALRDLNFKVRVNFRHGIAMETVTAYTDRKVVSVEEVTVPAGTFKSAKLSYKVKQTAKYNVGKKLSDDALYAEEWYVRGLGTVKEIYKVEGKGEAAEHVVKTLIEIGTDTTAIPKEQIKAARKARSASEDEEDDEDGYRFYDKECDDDEDDDEGEGEDDEEQPLPALDRTIDDMEMVFVKGGTFTMGCTPEQGDDCDDGEKPAHQVTVSDFSIMKYEVTQRLWREIMGNNPSHFKGDDRPVESVSWDDVQEFIERLNEKTGKKYRLPTEAEWEYAARGGNQSKGYKYSGSNNIDDVAWYSGNSGDKTNIVGTKAPNELGIYDMSGNVWEWVNDRYGAYTSDAKTNPTGSETGSNRVLRGGSWYSIAGNARVSGIRYIINPSYRYFNLGFRLAVSP